MRRALIVLATVLLSVPAALLTGAGTARAAATVDGPVHLPLPAGANWGDPVAANAAGVLAGAIGRASDAASGGDPLSWGTCSLRAARWNGSEVTTLPTPEGSWSRAYSINAAGTAVGFVSTAISPPACMPHAQAVSWAVGGQAVPLAPGYDGITVATSINDAGEIVGFATPPGAPGSSRLVDVRFVGGQAIPFAQNPLELSSDGMEIESELGMSTLRAPGPLLSNLPSGNLVAGSAIAESLGAYVYAIDAGSFIAEGTYRWLPGTPQAAPFAVSATVSISADRRTILGLEMDNTERSVLWPQIFRTGHPGYKPYVLAGSPGSDPAWASVMSPDASILVGFPRGGNEVIGLRGEAATTWLTVPGATIYGVTDSGLAYGVDSGGAATTWQVRR